MTTLSEEFAALWVDINPRLAELVAEARALRDVGAVYDTVETVGQMHDRLVLMRGAQDRLEGIMTEVARIRSRAKTAEQDAKDLFDDAMAAAMEAVRPPEYSSATERAAMYGSHCIQQRIEHRRAQRRLADITEAHEYVRAKNQGLNDARRDIDTRFRMQAFESRLESS